MRQDIENVRKQINGRNKVIPKAGDILRLTTTTDWMKGLQDRVMKIHAVDKDYALVQEVPQSAIFNHKHEIKISDWEFDTVSKEYLKVLAPDDVWDEEIED